MQLHEYSLPLKNGTFRSGLIIQNGECFGDVAPLPGFSHETFEEAKEETIRVLATGSPPKLPSVRFALACASTPLPEKIQLPVASLDREVPGFRAVKLKLGSLSVEEALALVKRTKTPEIRLDFNRKWPLEKLLRFAEHFTPNTFAYFEEPGLTFADTVAFSQTTGMPIAVDESIPEVPYWEIPTLKALIVKPTILGQIPQSNVELIFSSAYESAVGLLHIARLAHQHNPHQAHGLDPYSQFVSDVVTPRPVIADGMLSWEGALQLDGANSALASQIPSSSKIT